MSDQRKSNPPAPANTTTATKDAEAKTEVERLKAAREAGEPASMEGGGTNTFMSSRTLPNNPSPGDPNPIFPDEGAASAEAERDLEAQNRQARVTAAAEADAVRKGGKAPNKGNL